MEELLPAWLPKSPGMRLLLAGVGLVVVFFGARALRRSLPGISSGTAAAPIDTTGLVDTSGGSSGDSGVNTDPLSVLDGGSYFSPPSGPPSGNPPPSYTAPGASANTSASVAASSNPGSGLLDAASGGLTGGMFAGNPFVSSGILGGALGSDVGRSALVGGAVQSPTIQAGLLGGLLPALLAGSKTTPHEFTQSLSPYGHGAGQTLTHAQSVELSQGRNAASQRAHRGLSAPAHPNVAPVYTRGHHILD